MTTPLQAAAVKTTANPFSLLAHVSNVSSLKGGLDVLRRIQIPGAEMTTDSDLQGVSAVADTQEVSDIKALFGSQFFSEVPITSKGILLFYSIK